MRRPARAAVLLVALLACAHAAHAATEAYALADEIAAALEAQAEGEGLAEPEATLGDVFEPTSLPEGAETQAASEGAPARAESAPTCGSETECLALCPRDNVLSSDATEKAVQEQVSREGRRRERGAKGEAMRARWPRDMRGAAVGGACRLDSPHCVCGACTVTHIVDGGGVVVVVWGCEPRGRTQKNIVARARGGVRGWKGRR